MNPLIDIIPKFCNIRNKGGGVIPFTLYDWQEQFLNSMGDKNIILKARQIGASTLTCALLYLKTVAREGINTKIIANKLFIAQVLLDTISIIHNTIPKDIRPKCRHESRFEFFFEGLNSRLSISSSAKDAGRGETIHNLLCSEVAFWPNADDTMNGLLECVPKDGLIIVESTPNGVGNWFHKQYVKAEQKEIDWNEFKYDYKILPEYNTPEWRENKIKEKGIQGFAQEYDCNFILSRRLVFTDFDWIVPKDPERLEVYSGVTFNMVKDPVTGAMITRESAELAGVNVDDLKDEYDIKESITAPLRVWERPIADELYVIGCDVAEGLSKGDYSCAYIIKLKDMKVVACWHGHIAPDLFGHEIVKIAKWYNSALIGCEVNNHGLATINAMKDIYTNIYYRETFDEVSNQMSKKLGWHTNLKTKPLMIDDLNKVIRERLLDVSDAQLKSELQTFTFDDAGKMNAVEGCYDDRVIALAIAVQMYQANSYIEIGERHTQYM